MAEHWMQGAVKHPGGLHRALHIPQGQHIPPARIAAAEHSPKGNVRRMAFLAETFAHHRPGNPAAH